MLSTNRSPFPAVKVVLSSRPNFAQHSLCFTLICSDALTAHTSPTPLLGQIPSSTKYHLYNTVHYMRSHHVSMYKLLQASIHAPIHPLLLSAHGSFACVAVYTLACNYHHHSLTTPSPLPYQSLILCISLPSNLSLCSFAISLSFLDRVEAEGYLQRWSCESNIQVTEFLRART
jgi:hypothetical protein